MVESCRPNVLPVTTCSWNIIVLALFLISPSISWLPGAHDQVSFIPFRVMALISFLSAYTGMYVGWFVRTRVLLTGLVRALSAFFPTALAIVVGFRLIQEWLGGSFWSASVTILVLAMGLISSACSVSIWMPPATAWDGKALQEKSGTAGLLCLACLSFILQFGWDTVVVNPLLTGESSISLKGVVASFSVCGMVAFLGKFAWGVRGVVECAPLVYASLVLGGIVEFAFVVSVFGGAPVVPPGHGIVFSLIAAIIFMAARSWCLRSAEKGAEERAEEKWECGDAETEEDELRGHLERFSLTERELNCVLLSISGKASREVAGELKIKAPTVRSYLQRAYVKAGVSSLQELRALLEMEEAEAKGNSDGGVGKECETNATYGAVLGCFVACVKWLLVILVFCCPLVRGVLPLDLFICGVASGLLSLVAFPVGRPLPSRRFIGTVTKQLAFGLSGLFMLRLGATIIAPEVPTTLFDPQLVYIGSLSYVRVIAYVWRTGQLLPSFDSKLTYSFWVLSAFVMLSAGAMVSGLIWSTTACFAVVTVLIIRIKMRSNPAGTTLSRCDAASQNGNAVPLEGMIPLSVLSFFWTDYMYGPNASMVPLIAAPLLIVVAVGVIRKKQFGAVLKRSNAPIRITFLLGFAAPAYVAFLKPTGGGFGTTVVLAIAALFSMLGGRKKTQPFFCWQVFACALGLMGGLIFKSVAMIEGERQGILAVSYDWLDFAHGVSLSAIVLVVLVLISCCVVVAVCFVQESPALRMGRRTADRVTAFFIAQGLSEFEASVLLGIVKGKTGREIASELAYSLGGINSLRWSGYKKLGIHSRGQLISLLRRSLNDVKLEGIGED